MTSSLWHKRQQTRWKKQGLCVRCGGEIADKTHSECDKCLEYRRNWYTSRKELNK